MNPVDVTVLIPVRNRAALLERALQSVAAQTVRPHEVVVVDDGSTDASADVARRHGATVVVRDGPGNISAARNAGLAEAGTAWVAFLDSDDEWLPTHLERLLAAAAGQVFVTAPATLTDGRIHGNPAEHDIPLGPREMLVPSGLVATSGTMVDRRVALAVGGFRNISQSEDLDLWIRILEAGPGVALSRRTVRYHVHEGQISNDKAVMEDGFRWVLDQASTRPWCSRTVLQGALVRLAWDDFRRDLRLRQLGAAAGSLAWIVRHPRSWQGLLAVLRQRRLSRTATSGPRSA